MTRKLQIYGTPRSVTIRVLWLAHELAIPFELIEVPPGAEGSLKPEYLLLNPNGRVPSIDDDGLILWESFAINLYLAKKHGGGLAPADLVEDGLMTMWGFWIMTDLEPLVTTVIYNARLLAPAARDPAALSGALAALKRPLDVLDQALDKGGGYLVGGRFTVADLNVASSVYYLRYTPEALGDRPTLRRWYEAAIGRPARHAAYALRGEKAS